jgi:beta-lactamase class C
MMLKRFQIFIFLSLMLPFFAPHFGFCSEKGIENIDGLFAEFDSHVSAFIKKKEAPGVAIAIVDRGQIVFMKGYGVKKVGSPDQINIHTVFRIASLSKSFAAVLTGLLVDDGLIGWDDKVKKYLPDFVLADTANTENLTIRHVLSHTSGLLPHAYDNLIEANLPLNKIIGKLKNVNAICPVGECYAYQNVVYSLISPIIESASEQKYEAVLRDRLFLPLGMTDLTLSRDGLIANDNYARPHVKKSGKWTPTAVKATYYNVPPAAGINASIHDMAHWLKGLVLSEPNVIPPQVMNEICKPFIATKREMKRFNWRNRLRSASYGMGWRIFDYAGHTMIFHSGAIRGYLSGLAFLPEYQTGIVVLQNAFFENHLIYEFIDTYLEKVKKNDISQNASTRT